MKKIHLTKLKFIILFLTIIGPIGFFSFSAILGKPYGGSETSNSYIIYNTVLCLLTLTIVGFDIVKKFPAINKSYLILTLVLLCYLAEFFIRYTDTGYYGGIESLKQFGVWAIPASYAGVYLSRRERWKKLWKAVDLFMLMMTVNGASTAIIFAQNGWRSGSGTGATYQDASYMSAFAFGLNLYLLLNEKNYQRMGFTSFKSYRMVQYALLLVQLASMFICGGRGAIVLSAVYVFICLIKKKTIKRHMKLILQLILVTLTGILVLYLVGASDVLVRGFERATSFITSEGISWENTSGRNYLYPRVIARIKENPIMGLGIFAYRNIYGYPHNFFLEVLAQGGVIYFAIVMPTIIWCISKYIKNIKMQPSFEIIGILAVYPCVMLMFSGTYMASTIFWFTFGILLGMKGKKVNTRYKKLK